MSSLPLFPLSSVIMPGGTLPLRIFEPRYISMVRDAIKNDTGFGLCLIESGTEVGAIPQIFPVGTLVKIVDWDTDESGLLIISTDGIQKFRTLSTTVTDAGLLVGEVQFVPLEPEVAVPAELASLPSLLENALDDVSPLYEYSKVNLTNAVWVGNRLVELLPMHATERHEMMAMDDPIERLQALSNIVQDSIGN